MNASQIHSLSYPYVNVDAKKQKSLADIIEQNYCYQDLSRRLNPQSSCSFDAITIGLRFIVDSTGINFKNCMFVDTLGNCGTTAFYATSFGFKSVKSIEYSEDSLKMARSVLAEIRQESGLLNSKITLQCGSMLDYFAFDADVVYFDCTFITMDSMIDEGCLVIPLFKLCEKLLAGSFILVTTHGLILTTEGCVQLGFPFLDCVYTSSVNYDVVDSGDEFDQDIHNMTLYVLKKKVTKS